MKNIRYIVSALLGICLILSGCQNLTEPAGSTLPTVETGDALEITSHSATITGKYNPEHRRIYFLFSASADLSDAEYLYITGSSPSGGTINNLYQVYVSDLEKNHTYYYVLCVSDGVSEIRGEVKSFTTLSSIRLVSVTSTAWNDEQEEYNNDMLGAYLFYAEKPSIYQDYGNMYVEKSVIDGKRGWELPQEILPTNSNLKMCAYFPYQKEKIKEYMVPFGTYKYDEDVLWGVSNTLNEQAPNASIRMRHAMARVIFSIAGTANVLETTIITDFTLANRDETSGIPTYGYLNTYTGDFENCTYNLPVTRSTKLYPTDVAKNIEVLMFPAEFSSEAVLLILGTEDGHQLSVNLPQAHWEAGHQYTYPITYDEAHITIGDVVVENWNNSAAGDITVND